CSPSAPNDRTELACYSALRELGNVKGAAAELERLRRLRGAPDLYLPLSLHDALVQRDRTQATTVYQAMSPGERTLQGLVGIRTLDSNGATAVDTALIRDLLAGAPTAHDAPGSLASLLVAAGEDPLAPFAGVAEKVTAADREHRVMPDAASVILAHDE